MPAFKETMPLPNSIGDIRADFVRRGISSETPGFYDDAAFLAAEREDPRYLYRYARHVESIGFSERYLQAARPVIENAATILAEAVTLDGRPGLCVNVSCALSRMLERHGIWNYIARGLALVRVRTGDHVLQQGFHAIECGATPLAHTWVVAPPFRVVDVTFAQQALGADFQPHLWSPILLDRLEEFRFTPDLFYSTEAARLGIRLHGSLAQDLAADHSEVSHFTTHLPGGAHGGQAATLLYQATGITAPDSALEGITGIALGGRSFVEIYDQDILPRLRTLGLGASVGSARD